MQKELTSLKKRTKMSISTSKVILVIILLYIALLTPPVLYIALKGNTSPLECMIQGTFALSTISVGFYYWKAKAENLHKYNQDEKITMNGE